MKNILLIVVAVLAIGSGAWILSESKNKTNISQPIPSTTLNAKFQTPKTDSQSGVEIVVTPKELTSGKPIIFAVSFTAHEGELAINLAKSSTLEIDGSTLPAVSWDGGSGGHHLSGNLSFPDLKIEPAKIVLKMNNVAGADRTFAWE